MDRSIRGALVRAAREATVTAIVRIGGRIRHYHWTSRGLILKQILSRAIAMRDMPTKTQKRPRLATAAVSPHAVATTIMMMIPHATATLENAAGIVMWVACHARMVPSTESPSSATRQGRAPTAPPRPPMTRARSPPISFTSTRQRNVKLAPRPNPPEWSGSPHSAPRARVDPFLSRPLSTCRIASKRTIASVAVSSSCRETSRSSSFAMASPSPAASQTFRAGRQHTDQRSRIRNRVRAVAS